METAKNVADGCPRPRRRRIFGSVTWCCIHRQICRSLREPKPVSPFSREYTNQNWTAFQSFQTGAKSIAHDFSHNHARRRKTEGPGYKRRRAEAAVAIQAGTVFRFRPRPANRAVWLGKHGSFGGKNAVNIHGRTVGGEAPLRLPAQFFPDFGQQTVM